MCVYEYVFVCMSMYLCVWVCMCVYEYVCACVCMSMYVCVWVCMYVYEHLCVWMNMYVCINIDDSNSGRKQRPDERAHDGPAPDHLRPGANVIKLFYSSLPYLQN